MNGSPWNGSAPVPSRAVGERTSLAIEDLPEVRELVSDGWFLASDAPLWSFLPAVWPADLRTWVPDRSTRYVDAYRSTPGSGTETWREPMSAADLEEIERDLDDLAAAAGFSGRPHGRIWLLKPIAGRTPEQVCELVAERLGATGLFASPELAAETKARIDELLSRG